MNFIKTAGCFVFIGAFILFFGLAGRLLNDHPQDRLLWAIEQVESQGRVTVLGDNGEAVGILQIHPIMVEDCNRILGREEFTLDDRWSQDRSERMFEVYRNHYSAGCSDEVVARRWNGGPQGERYESTRVYWERVKARMNDRP